MQAGEAPGAFVAALHCLLHVPQLAHYVLTDAVVSQDALRKRQNACAFLDAFVALARAFFLGGGGDDDPPSAADAWAAARKLCKASVLKSDSVAEFVKAALRSLHDALGKTAPMRDSLAAKHVDAEAWSAHNAREGYSFLTEVFQAQVRETVWSMEAEEVSHAHPWVLELDVEGFDTLRKALRARHAPREPVKRLGEHELATVESKFAWAPLALVIALRRSKPQYVEYPAELDVSPHRVDMEDCRYALCAVAASKPEGDHVVYAVEDEAWRELRPGDARPLGDIEAIVQKHATVLVYRSLNV